MLGKENGVQDNIIEAEKKIFLIGRKYIWKEANMFCDFYIVVILCLTLVC